MTTPLVMTIGHSNHSVERLVDLLRAHEVTAIGDVRSSPYSRQNPDFNREFLQHRLKDSGITYLYLGRELGARPQDPSLYEKGRVQYRKLSRDTLFREGLRQVLLVAQSSRLALFCAEREPLACHRSLLIAREITALDLPVTHIHADGSLETHPDAMTRLILTLRLPENDLFRTRDEIIADACTLQEHRIAYVDDHLREESST